MRIKTAILFAFLLNLGYVSAQNVAIGERAPRVKSFKVQIEEGKYLYMGFVHSPSRPCEVSAPKVLELIKSNDAISATLFTKEGENECEKWLVDISKSGTMVVMEADEIFHRFGVEYAPFGVVLDHKQRVLWQGNPQTLDKSKIENIIQQWTSQR